MPKHANPDPEQLDKFGALASQWWDQNGPMAPLHALNPTRLNIIRDLIENHFQLDPNSNYPLTGLNIIDVGCGGGLVTEPLARLGANVTGLDPCEPIINAAQSHARSAGLNINYTTTGIENITSAFDVVLALEIVEHVPDLHSFISQCAKPIAPEGMMILSTLNRTAKALILAIVGAEYILGWLPRQTHRFDRFIRPQQLKHALRSAGLQPTPIPIGMVYNPFNRRWQKSHNYDVNYMLTATRPKCPNHSNPDKPHQHYNKP